MLQQNELITFMVGLGVVVYLIINRTKLLQLPRFRCLFAAYVFLFISWTLTIAEGFFLSWLMNTLEHAFYALSSLSLAAWSWKAFVKGEPDR